MADTPTLGAQVREYYSSHRDDGYHCLVVFPYGGFACTGQDDGTLDAVSMTRDEAIGAVIDMFGLAAFRGQS